MSCTTKGFKESQQETQKTLELLLTKNLEESETGADYEDPNACMDDKETDIVQKNLKFLDLLVKALGRLTQTQT